MNSPNMEQLRERLIRAIEGLADQQAGHDDNWRLEFAIVLTSLDTIFKELEMVKKENQMLSARLDSLRHLDSRISCEYCMKERSGHIKSTHWR